MQNNSQVKKLKYNPAIKRKTGNEGSDRIQKLYSSTENISLEVGFEVRTAVVMKNSIFWDITPSIPLKLNRRFGGTCPSSELKNKPSLLPASCFFLIG
jgi:hypothetical protein